MDMKRLSSEDIAIIADKKQGMAEEMVTLFTENTKDIPSNIRIGILCAVIDEIIKRQGIRMPDFLLTMFLADSFKEDNYE